MLKKYLHNLIILLPLTLLVAASAYFAYDSWFKYQNNTALNAELSNAKLLKSLEHSVLNEIVCVATMSQHKNLMAKVCTPTKKTTDAVMNQILDQKEDVSLYKLEKIIFNIRNTIEDRGTVAVEKLVNGNLDKEMNTFIQKYTDKLKSHSYSMDKKEYLRLYSDISDISYATESEKALVSYYLSLHKPIPAKNLIYWDKMITQSQIPESNGEHISILHEDIESILKSKDFQSTLRGIEDIRLDIMSNTTSGKYKSSVATWVSFLNKKQKVLTHTETILLDSILSNVVKELKESKITLIISLVALLLSMLALLFLIRSWSKEASKKKLLDDLVGKISQISSDDSALKVTDSTESYKLAYDYIGTNYESLHEKTTTIEIENKTNTAFLNNLTYEIRTPLNGISGYTKLLKETPLNIEQNDFLSIIENNFEDLDTILGKISNENMQPHQKLEVDNIVFDIVKKMESSVETFSIKADQKDIVLGLYIDPLLGHKVKGDGTKLSQIITNLIDNALDSSNAYDTIDISIEKLHNDEHSVTIKFSVTDQGIGYNEDELNQIKRAFSNMEMIDAISNIDMKNLGISEKIIKRMGGKLEVSSEKGEGSTFFFILTFEKDNAQTHTKMYPTFEGMKIGLALPNKNIERQIDKNLESYVKHLKGEFEIYDYEMLFENEKKVSLPDLMFVYHNYARLEGELEEFLKLPSKIALITSGSLRARINLEKYHFSSIVYAPITMSKIVKIFAESKLDKSLLEKESVVENNVNIDEVSEFNNLHALVAEDNKISQKIIVNILEKFGIEVTLASDGKEAFALQKDNHFNIIFLDLDIPIMDGTETTSKILYHEGINQKVHTPIIALTNDIKVKEEDLCMKSGMDDCLVKPIDEDKVYKLVQKYCIELPQKHAQTEEDELIAKVLSGDFLKE